MRIHSAGADTSTTLMISGVAIMFQRDQACWDKCPQTAESYAIARPKKMIASQSTMVASAAAFRPAENSAVVDVRASGRTVRPNMKMLITLIGSSDIFSQNETAV